MPPALPKDWVVLRHDWESEAMILLELSCDKLSSSSFEMPVSIRKSHLRS
jgi:hypothetical protein